MILQVKDYLLVSIIVEKTRYTTNYIKAISVVY